MPLFIYSLVNQIVRLQDAVPFTSVQSQWWPAL